MLEFFFAVVAALVGMPAQALGITPPPASASTENVAAVVQRAPGNATQQPQLLRPTTQAPFANLGPFKPFPRQPLFSEARLPTATPSRKVVGGKTYDAYIDAASKNGQWFHYTCEFDAAWIVLKTLGHDVSLAKMIEVVGLAKDGPEPYHKQTANGVVIYGGNIFEHYSGDYKKNFLARSTGKAMTKLFTHYGLKVTPVNDRASLEAALRRGEPIWIKTTVDFKDWTTATWVMPDGTKYKTVLGNDHSNVVIGYSERGVLIQDPLGPTSTGLNRPLRYEVSWDRFLRAWGSQQYDGLAVGK
jgi:uncharacterized protein YvpB